MPCSRHKQREVHREDEQQQDIMESGWADVVGGVDLIAGVQRVEQRQQDKGDDGHRPGPRSAYNEGPDASEANDDREGEPEKAHRELQRCICFITRVR